MPNSNPVIVVVAFNRESSLKRLLTSLERASYPKKVKLVISIDKGNNKDVLQSAQDFIWSHGEKEVVYQSENLGLKQHILQCGDLSEKYGSVIILEDDLYVSPYFYEYTMQALDYYKDDNRISQISLYRYPVNNNTKDRFIPLEEASDNFFMNVASSWGQAWNFKQWSQFRQWLKINDLSITYHDDLPDFVIKWKETSWLKYFIKYNVDTERFTLFPKVSLTTNFSDSGTHVTIDDIYMYQQPLMIDNKLFDFKSLDESKAIYDAYYELHPMAIQRLFPEYQGMTMDLYGSKCLEKVTTKYLASVKKCKRPIRSFAMSLKPHEINLIDKLEGEQISIGLTSDFEESVPDNVTNIRFRYYWTHALTYADMIQLFLFRTRHKYANLMKMISSRLR